MTSRQQKIDSIKAKLQQLEAAERAANQRARAAASKRTRQEDTRRKILVGAWVLDQTSADALHSIAIGGVTLDQWLTRADDRALFGLASPSDGAAAAAPASLLARTVSLEA